MLQGHGLGSNVRMRSSLAYMKMRSDHRLSHALSKGTQLGDAEADRFNLRALETETFPRSSRKHDGAVSISKSSYPLQAPGLVSI